MDKSAAWYNDGDFSDLTLKLSDDREIKVHKLVLCKQNQYFASMCGPSSSFAEAKQSVIKLEEDNPDAMEAVLRHIYGCPLPTVGKEPDWRFWLDLAITANKYLEPELTDKSRLIFSNIVMKIQEADDIFNVMQMIWREAGHINCLLEVANQLRRMNIMELQKNERYRERLLSDREFMIAHLNDLDRLVVPKRKMCASCRGQSDGWTSQDNRKQAWQGNW